jgi:Phosphate-selective porin O and P
MRNKYLAAALVAGVSCLAMQAHADNSWADNTKIGGKMYWDFTSINTQKNGADVDPNGLGFDVKRFYIGVDHDFGDSWSANFTSDFNYLSTDKETQIFVKKAYVQKHWSDAAVLRLGSADMPWIPFAEDMYGYRFVENTLIDRLHYGNSADWGAHFLGKDGGFNYAFSVVNGGGYKNPSRSKSVDEEGRVAFQPVDGLTFAVGAYSGKRGLDTEAAPAINTASRWDFLANYKVSAFHVGVEYFTADNWNNVTTAATDKADGYSLFGDVTVAPDVAVFARYDSAKPSKDLDSSEKDTYYNFGVSFKSNKQITWAVAYKSEKLADNTNELKTNEIGVWAQVAF